MAIPRSDAGAHPVTPSWPTPREGRLDGGLRVVVVPAPHLHTASVSVFARVGSRYERPRDNGLSHFLEHVVFRGSEGWPTAWALNEALERAATGVGAATYRDFGAFDATCAPARVPEVLRLFGAMLSAPALNDLELERRIILEEIADEVDERGRDVEVDNVAKLALFPGGGIGHRIGGTPARVRGFDLDDCRRWLESHYGAENMVVAVAGAVDPDAVLEATRGAFAGLRPGPRRDPVDVPPRGDLPALEYVAHAGSQVEVQLSWVLPGERHEDWPALSMAHRLLEDGTCARLHQGLVDERGLAYDVGADLETYEGRSLLTVEASVSPGNAIALVDATLEIVDALSERPAADAEWTRIRDRLAFELASTVDAPAALCSWYGLRLLHAPHDGPAERWRRLMAVDPAESAESAARHLRPEHLQVTVVGDLDPMARAALRRRIHRLRGR
ncbi:MAG: M16 family metallopeptidase [Myxococcota bacterium]